MEEEIYNKWLEMIEEDEKRDGISMLEQRQNRRIIDFLFFAQIHTHSSQS